MKNRAVCGWNRRVHSRPRRRSPQCRVCPSASRGGCHWGWWREYRCHLCPCSTLYKSPLSLEKGEKEELNPNSSRLVCDSTKHPQLNRLLTVITHFSLVWQMICSVPLQAQDWRFCVASQKGLHSPAWHRPLSTHTVSSSAFSGGGHSLLLPATCREGQEV